jgi:hypothetical protein
VTLCKTFAYRRATVNHALMLTPNESEQFQYIVESAAREGWIASNERLDAIASQGYVIVTRMTGDTTREKRYPHDARWQYQLLRDLAHGVFP